MLASQKPTPSFGLVPLQAGAGPSGTEYAATVN